MKRVAFLFFALTCCALATADNVQTVRKTLDANYKGFSQAFLKKDSKALFALMTDDYTVTQPNGATFTKDQIKASLDQQMKIMTSATWVRKITSLKLNGKDAIAVVDGLFQGKATGPDGKAHDVKVAAHTTDTWTKVGKIYKLKKSVVSKNDVTVDGKPTGQPG